MNAQQAKAMTQIAARRNTKTSVVMFCTAEIAATALKGIGQMTIDIAPVTINSSVGIATVVEELKALGYAAYKLGDTRVYVAWNDAKEILD